MDPRASFGYWMRRRRKALDLTQQELAQQVGSAVGTIQKLEADERRPSKQLAMRLADLLQIPLAERDAFVRVARAELAADRLEIGEPALESAPAATPTNLPTPATPFIGREHELAAVRHMIGRDDVRLVTLTGPGGTGKSRLSVQAAKELLGLFEHGIWFVNLAPIGDASLVASSIANALGVREIGGQPIVELLKRHLREQRTLLLLDNFEHVIEAAPIVSELLAFAPGLKVLATSRITLRLSAEHEFAVLPLALPPTDQEPRLAAVATTPGWRYSELSSAAELSQYEAVRLFIQRARAAKADFAATNQNAPAIAEICYRLDGLPLAIELAAARSKLFPPQALLERLGSRLKFLTGGARDQPARQQTIRNTIDWSYNLLDEREKILFARLGAFVGGCSMGGGCTFEAAEAVCNADGTLPLDVVDGIAALVDKSLLRQDQGAEEGPRFVMLGTIREYALERLEQRGETEALRRWHAEYFLALAERAEPELAGPRQGAWLARLERDVDNLRAALGWSLEHSEQALGLRLTSALALFWHSRSHWDDHRSWSEAALALGAPAAPPRHSAALARSYDT